MTFGKILKELRLENRLYQKNLATVFNVSQHTIFSWEAGRQEPDISRLVEIARFFNVSLDYLCGKTSDINFRDEYPPALPLTVRERECLALFAKLEMPEQAQTIGFMKAFIERTNTKKNRGTLS